MERPHCAPDGSMGLTLYYQSILIELKTTLRLSRRVCCWLVETGRLLWRRKIFEATDKNAARASNLSGACGNLLQPR